MTVLILLAGLLLYTVYHGHYPVDLGIPGVNVVNLAFAAAVALLMARRPAGPVPTPRLAGPLVGYAIAMVLATAIGMVFRPGDVLDDLTYLKTLLFFPLYYLLFFHAVRDETSARRLILVVLGIAVLASLEAVREAIDYGIGSYSPTHRSAGPFGPDYRSANRAGVYYAMFLPMFVAAALFLKGRPAWRLAAAGIAVLVAAAILFTYSRQSYAIGLLVVALLALRRNVLAAVVLAAGFVVAVPYLPEGASQRVQETQQVGEYGQEEVDDSTASRWDLWSGAWSMWLEHPAGVGANRFKQEIGAYSHHPGMDAHNYFVLTLAEAGLQGLLALLLLVAGMWRLSGWMLSRSVDPESHALASGFRVAVLAMVLGNLYGSPFTEGAVMGTFWALAGVLERWTHLRRVASPSPAHPAVSVPRRSVGARPA